LLAPGLPYASKALALIYGGVRLQPWVGVTTNRIRWEIALLKTRPPPEGLHPVGTDAGFLWNLNSSFTLLPASVSARRTTTMIDDKINRVQPDRSRINMDEDYEVKYWIKHLDVSRSYSAR
jgi:hypothetical protein